MDNNQDPKALVLAQQGGVVITALATLALAGLKIAKVLQGDSNPELPSE